MLHSNPHPNDRTFLMQRIAMIGLGIMGSGMAANWLAKGFPVTVYNRTRAKAEPLAAKGARIADSPRAAAEGADIVVAMVSDDAASQKVWQGSDGALAGLKSGAIVIESSTLTPEWVRELAGLAKVKGAAFLDAPVGGSKSAANEGKLVFFVGGESATVEKARAALEAVGTKITHLGPAGAGATWKLINNVMAASQLAVLSEGLAIAAKAGIDLAQAAELIKNSATASPMVVGKLPRIMDRRYADPDFALKLMRKDVAYAAALAKALGVKVEVVPAVAGIYERAEAKGLGESDTAAVRDAVG
jgi:3-hydroxyisobutyrate dehydrogenase